LSVDVRVLGQVQVLAAGADMDTGRPKQRTVLAVLAVNAGRLVSTEMLLSRVWGEEAPAGARRSLHTYVARLRRVLDQAAAADAAAGGTDPPAKVTFRAGGYVLQIEPTRVDLHRFRRLMHQSRDPACSSARRLAALRAAVTLWSDEPLAGVPGQWAAASREAWQLEYLDSVIAWTREEIRDGDPGAVIGRVAELIEEHPLAEPLAAALMRALYAAGSRTEALERYTATRARLIDELGAEPGPELRALHRAVLRGEPLPDASMPAAPPAPPTPIIPAQLPADVPGFTGRVAELSQLDSALAAEGGSAAVVVSGMAGAGKTALAVHWAHRVRGRFPDGQLYVNLRGFDPTGQVMATGDAVRGFLDGLGVAAERIPVSLDAQAALYRSLLTGKRVLVVADNARDAEQVRLLLPGSSACMTILTSRNQLTALVANGARPLRLDMMATSEAAALLAARLPPARLAAEPAAVEEIIRRCARLPLALAIVAARSAAHPDFPLAALAGELGEPRRLDALAGGDSASDARTVFSWSYQALSPAAASMFRLLGVHPGPDVSTPAAASLAGLPVGQVRPALTELVGAHLAVEQTPSRYSLHDLLRAYAADLTGSLDSVPLRLAAVRRVLDHYLHTSHTAARLLYPRPNQITPAPLQPGVSPEDVVDDQAAMTWFTTEHHVLLAVLTLAAGCGLDGHVWQLAWALRDYLSWRGHWADWAATQAAALQAAERLGDPSAQVLAHRGLARVHTELGRHEDALGHLEEALKLAGQLADQTAAAQVHLDLARSYTRHDHPRQALEHATAGLASFQAAGDTPGQAQGLNQVGWCHALLGEHQHAIAYCERALTLFQRINNRWGEAGTWDSLGYANHHLGQFTAAVGCYQHSLERYREVGDRYGEAEVLTHLGDSHQAAGLAEPARATWSQALQILAGLAHPAAGPLQDRLRHSYRLLTSGHDVGDGDGSQPTST
jgi:DNA-binding SARP family transcriptional activator/tetratricopeptide (TPR) repeat protein